MKRITGILCLIILTTMMAAPFAFGADAELKVTESYPKDDSSSMPLQNVGIKLYFNGNVTDKSVSKENLKSFRFYDNKGKKIPTKAYLGKGSDNNYILVTANPKKGTLKSNTDYKMVISKGMKSADGKVMSKDNTINFTTVDQELNSKINMGMMGLMVVGMLVMSFISAKRATQKETKKKDDKVNPYKVAKEKGKSVEEVVSKMEKSKERKAKMESRGKKSTSEDEKSSDVNVKKVKGPSPISAAGSTLKPPKKTTKPKKSSGGNNNNKSKNSKSKKKKKKK